MAIHSFSSGNAGTSDAGDAASAGLTSGEGLALDRGAEASWLVDDGSANPTQNSLADYATSVAADDAAMLRYYTGLSTPFSISSPSQSAASDGGDGPLGSSTTSPSVALLEDYGAGFPQAGPPGIEFFAGGRPGGGGGGGSGTPPPPYTPPAQNGLTFVINWDSSVGSAPKAFVGAFETAVQYFLDNLSPLNPVTVTLNVGWGEVNGSKLSPFALGQSLTYVETVPYGTLQSKMPSLAGVGDPTNGTYWVATAEEEALGLGVQDSTVTIDGAVGFSSRVSWNFSASSGSGYDFISVAEHEISESMGRIALLGATVGGMANSYTPLDLFRYSAQDTRSLVGGQDAYFSFNGGISSGSLNLQGNSKTYFNSTAGGDWGDWQSSGAHSAGNDAYNAFASSGVDYSTSTVDKTVMQVLGYGTPPTA